jgi:hypothetical protein
MSDHELFEVARELILDVMESLADKGVGDTPLALCAMMVPILHCAHDCSPSASEVRRLINAANKFARDLSERGGA